MRRVNDERGASLMMVTVFVMVFGIIGAAILQFATTGFRVTEAIAEVRDEQHAVDGAMDGAINAIRGSSTVGLRGKPCPTFTYDAEDPDPDVVVTCAAAGGTTGGVADEQPKYAVLTLGRSPSHGFSQSGNEALVIDGGIFSNSHITVGGGSKDRIRVFGDAYAVLGCLPEGGTPPEPLRLSASGERVCHLGSKSSHSLTAGEADPAYPAAVGGVATLAVDPEPSCASTNSVIRFTPGLYTERPDRLVPAGCKGNAWWFDAGPSGLGAYYFDFPESDSLWDLHALQVNVVGGTPSGWSAFSPSSSVHSSFPNACDPAGSGVQFIFGGSTRMSAQTTSSVGKVSLCSSDSPKTNQQIVLYGLGADGIELEGRTATSETLVTKVAPTGDFQPADAAWKPGGGWAAAELVGGETSVVTETFSDFEDVPLGTSVSKVLLKIDHVETGLFGASLEPQVTITSGSMSKTIQLTNRSTSTGPEIVDITADLAEFKRYGDVNELSAVFEVDGSDLEGVREECTGGGKAQVCEEIPADVATAELDSVFLEVDHMPPGFRPHVCPASKADCAIFTTGNNPAVVFAGTVYAPNAHIDVSVHNNGLVLFNRGLIARSVRSDSSASMKQGDSPFQLPGTDDLRGVTFEAFVGSQVRLRARVSYTDTDGGVILPGYRVRVRDWVVVR